MKWLNKIKLRKINVLGKTFLWKRGHYHLEEFEHSQCVEKVIIYLQDHKNSPLHLFFREEDNSLITSNLDIGKWCVGYPDQGVIWWFSNESTEEGNKEDNIELNLNRPKVIETLIKHFMFNGWKPETDKKPYIVNNALTMMPALIKL